jgi:hypothetical protein
MFISPFIPQKKLLANVDLANLLQQKAFERLPVPVFHKNVENLVDPGLRFALNPDFSALYSSLNHDRSIGYTPGAWCGTS